MKHNLYDMIQQKQGSPHDCTDNTTSTTRRLNGTKPAQGLRKILAILMLMTISISAWAADYVFRYNGNYLGVNAAGTAVQNYTSFDPRYCIWTCDEGLSTTSHSLYVTIGGTKHYLVTNTTDGNSVSTQTGAWANWRSNGTRLYYPGTNNNRTFYLYYRDNSWRTSRTQGYNGNNTSWQGGYSGYIDYRATATTSTTTGATDNTTAPTITCNGLSGNAGILMSHTELGGTYTPAVTTIIVDGTTYYKGTDGVYSATAPSASLDPSYRWSIQSGNASIGVTSGVLIVSGTGSITVRLTTTYVGSLTKNTDFTLNVSETVALNEIVDPNIAVTPASATLDLAGSTQEYEVPATLNRTRRTCDAYYTITPNGGSTYYKVGSDYTTTQPSVVETPEPLRLKRVNWTPSGTGYTYFSISNNVNPATLTRSTNLTSENLNFTLTAEAHYGTNEIDVQKSATAQVAIPFSEVDLNSIYNCASSNTSLRVGESATLSFEYQPQDQGQGRPHVEIEYSSSAESVATVSSEGVVTAVGPGSATITIQSITIAGAEGESCDVDIQVTTPAAQPTFSRSDNTLTITSTTTGVRIYYTTDGSTPTVYRDNIENGGSITISSGQTIKAIAANTSAGYTPSTVATFFYGNGNSAASPYPVCTESDFAYVRSNPEKYYRLQNDITITGTFTSIDNFTGSFDGDYYTIKGLGSPLFDNINGGTVKNVRLADVSISGGTDAGAIANTANNAKIYNCGVLSGSVSGTRYVGGLVGAIFGSTIVVNNYNYASVSGGTYAAGVVGYNGASNANYLHEDDGTSMEDWPRPTTNTNGNYQANNQNRPDNYSNGNLSGGTCEAWRGGGNNLQTQNIHHNVLNNLPAGIYTVSVDLVINRANPSGIQFYLNGASDITNQEVIRNNGYYEAHIVRQIAIAQNGSIEFGFNLNNVNFNWMQWDNARVELSNGEELTRAMYHQWSSYQANAQISGGGNFQGGWGTAAGTVYGDGNVRGDTYVDLSDYSVLALTVATGTPRLLFNRQGITSQGAFIEINSQNSDYVLKVENGVWYYDLGKIKAWNNLGYAHLNVIKGANNQNVNITRAKLFNSSIPMIANCMFYGDVESDEGYPIYGGVDINSATIASNYNYYSLDDYKHQIAANHYNSALAAEKRYLERFEFYRNILNSNRRLAAFYITGQNLNRTDNVDVTKNPVGKWVLDKSIAPYPIIKPWGKYPSLINPEPETTITTLPADVDMRDDSPRYHGKTLGMLAVTVKSGAQSSGADKNIQIPITDMNVDEWDYTYYKIQLPYYNDHWNDNYQNAWVVTGWDITSITGGTSKGFNSNREQDDGYNFADRSNKDKDLQSGRTLAQGGWFCVPEGVTAIEITAHWGHAVYLADEYVDRRATLNGNLIGGVANNTAAGTNFSHGTVYKNSWNSAASDNSLSGTSVYDNAVVLVGNYNYNADGSFGDKPCTIMSADFDHDNEPDYVMYYRNAGGNDRHEIKSVRFDFITMPGLGIGKKPTNAVNMSAQEILQPTGHFELTETSLARFTEFEYNQNDVNGAPLIFNAGIIEQIMSGQTSTNNSVGYILLGGHCWFKAFTPGIHVDGGTRATAHAPITVLGGEYETFYLSGINGGNAYTTDGRRNARIYTNGGYFHTFAGAGQEQINGYVLEKFDHSIVDEFYGGGINANKPILGNITITIDHSLVNYFCGGPKFGNMSTEKEVRTSATGSTFGSYFGAGYGGTSYVRVARNSGAQVGPGDYPLNWILYSRFGYNGTYGISVQYEIEYFDWAGAGNENHVHRYYDRYATFSLAQTKNVYSDLTDCHVLKDFFGGGSFGNVDGNTTSTLTNCVVEGSAYGGGFSAVAPKCVVYNNDPLYKTAPKYNQYTGIFTSIEYPDTVEYSWKYVTSTISATNNHVDGNSTDSKKYIYTDINIDGLGVVTGNTNITINGGEVYHHVFGGGFGSKVNNNTNVMVKGPAFIHENVYGGGNAAEVNGNTNVVIGE